MSNTIHYSELGLVNTRDMFAKAVDGGYAIPAYNFNNLEQLQAIVTGCAESDSPFILQVSSGARKYANQTLLQYMAQGAAALVVRRVDETAAGCRVQDHHVRAKFSQAVEGAGAVAFLHLGDLYIVDTLNGRVERLTGDGQSTRLDWAE